MIVVCVVLGDGTNRTGHRHLSHTLIKVDPVTATAHAADVSTGADLGPRTTPNPAPLWRIVVRIVIV